MPSRRNSVIICYFYTVSFIRNINGSNLADAELLKLYRQDANQAVLGELYQRYMDLVFGVCLKYLKDREAARDAVMNIYTEMVDKLKKHEVEHFKSWLHTVARNHCLMQLRSPRNLKTKELNTELVQNEEYVHLNGELEKEEHFNKLEKCLQTLIKEQEESIRLFYLEKKCYQEIAEITGYDWNQVRSYIQNGRRNLKICMDKR
ncbi:MAG: sigma-70 family RNA polymerase sigma factor [Dinghuibacter sp.]|nr:sigma-70 family RNA polymerase sigma factor [Dinghuibacter sp.]